MIRRSPEECRQLIDDQETSDITIAKFATPATLISPLFICNVKIDQI